MKSTQLDATASVPGNCIYIPSSGTVLNVGPQMLNVLFVPTDLIDYNITSAPASINVLNTNTKTTPTITWSNPADIVYETALSGTQLDDATGSVAGSISYSPDIGTVLGAGTHTLTATLTPTDIANYIIPSAHVLINVTQLNSTSNLSSPANIPLERHQAAFKHRQLLIHRQM